MKIIETGLEGLLVLEPKVIGDERGYFFESYNKNTLNELGLLFDFIQDNEAKSAKKIFRGFHYQLPPFAQTKLVRVIAGAVIDMVIDIRPHSRTYGKTFQIELSSSNKLQFLVPKGFAHGYLSLEDDTVFAYKVDQFYNRLHEKGISYQDENLNFEWPFDSKELITSEKDTLNPRFGEHVPYE